MALSKITNDGLGANLTATSEGGAVTTSIQQGLAKAWVNFNGTGTLAVGDSLNISSVTDAGTGDYDINISNAFASANYSATVSGYPQSTWNQFMYLSNPATHTASTYAVYSVSNAGTYYDTSLVNTSAHGDLA